MLSLGEWHQQMHQIGASIHIPSSPPPSSASGGGGGGAGATGATGATSSSSSKWLTRQGFTASARGGAGAAAGFK